MPRYYRVSPAIWNEPWDDDMRLLALYLLTSPHRTTEGLFRLPRPYVQADLGWAAKRIVTTMDELEQAEFIKTSGDVVLILNALKYQAPQNPNGIKAAINAVETVPATVLDTEFLSLAQRFCQPLAERLKERLPKRFGQPLALTPSPTQSSSPSSFDDDVAGFQEHLETRCGADPADAFAVATRFANRKRFGAPITDPIAWAQPILDQLQAARRAGEENDGELELKAALIDGERFVFVAGGWLPESEYVA